MNHAKFYLILRKITLCYPIMLGHLVYVNRKGTLAGMYQTRFDDKINFKVKFSYTLPIRDEHNDRRRYAGIIDNDCEVSCSSN